MMDFIMLVAGTSFFALSWSLVILCDRLAKER